MENFNRLFYEITELGTMCGLFYGGANRCVIYTLADTYWVVCTNTKAVLYHSENLEAVYAFMDAILARFRGCVY